MAKRKRNANKAARTRAAHKVASEDAMQVDPPTKDAAPKPTSGSGTDPSPARKQRVRAVSPRSLLDMKSSFELTHTVYRAISAHERLYKDAGVLHGDINPNTILILDWPASEPDTAARSSKESTAGTAPDSGKSGPSPGNEDRPTRNEEDRCGSGPSVLEVVQTRATEGALVDFDVPYSDAAWRHPRPGPFKMENHSALRMRRLYRFGYGLW